jgi:AcrR family transcriptional regulator
MKNVNIRQEKRRRIMTAAMSLFSRTHDVKRVSLEDIATEAGVSPTTIYNNFGDRESLLFEILKDLTRQQLDRNRALVQADLPFPQKLIGIISGKMEVVEKVNGELIEKLITQDKKLTPFIEQIYQQEIKPLWKEIIADGKRQGYVDLSVDEGTLLIYLDIIQAGWKAQPGLFRDFKNNMGLIEQLTRLMFFGFLKKDIDLFQKEGKTAHD